MIQSGFSAVDATNQPQDYIHRLDATAAEPFWRMAKFRTFDLLDLHAGDRVLDLGCGTGDDVRALAQRVLPAGEVVGIDSSRTMVREAQRRAETVNLPVRFEVGDAHHLAVPDTSFDACRAERILQHLDDPWQAFLELVRVARSGARLVVVEPDYGAVSIRGADPSLSRKIIAARCSHFRHGTIGRELPLFFRRVALQNVAVTILTISVETLRDKREHALLTKHVAIARATGAISEQQGVEWLAELEAADAADQYRRSVVVFLVSGRKAWDV